MEGDRGDVFSQKGRVRVWRAASGQESAVRGRRDEEEEKGRKFFTLLDPELPVNRQNRHDVKKKIIIIYLPALNSFCVPRQNVCPIYPEIITVVSSCFIMNTINIYPLVDLCVLWASLT